MGGSTEDLTRRVFFVGAFGDLPSLCHKKWICLYLKEEMVLSQTKEEEEAVSSGFG